jgi:hypothetical protein
VRDAGLAFLCEEPLGAFEVGPHLARFQFSFSVVKLTSLLRLTSSIRDCETHKPVVQRSCFLHTRRATAPAPKPKWEVAKAREAKRNVSQEQQDALRA